MRYCPDGMDGKLRSWCEQDPHRHWAGTLIFNPRHAPCCLVSGSAHSRDHLWPWKVSALLLPRFSVTNPFFPWDNEVDYRRPKWPSSFLLLFFLGGGRRQKSLMKKKRLTGTQPHTHRHRHSLTRPLPHSRAALIMMVGMAELVTGGPCQTVGTQIYPLLSKTDWGAVTWR